jgi:MFS family permease
MLALLARRPAFRTLWLAGTISLVGDWLSFVAIGTLALTAGDRPVGLALVLAAHAVPAALVSPVWGAVVDRFDRRRLLVLADLGAGLLTLAMAELAVAGHLGAVQALLLVRSALTAIVPPAESAALRHVVEPGELGGANTVLAGTWSLTFVAGMALGGVFATLGPGLAIALDGVTFLIAAGVHARLPALPAAPGRARRIGAVLTAVPADTLQALRTAQARPALLGALLGKTPVALAGGAGWLVLNLVAAAERPFGSAALSAPVPGSARSSRRGSSAAARTPGASPGSRSFWLSPASPSSGSCRAAPPS